VKSATFAKSCEAFSRSASIYDLLHAKRDRTAELKLIAAMLGDPERTPPASRRIIDWGAGTGEHVLRWPTYGWKAVGFDTSIPMVQEAQAKGADVRPGDICEQPLEANFAPASAQTCLFAAFSYATVDPVGLAGALDTVRRWSVKGGLFVFDALNYACCCAHLEPSAQRKYEGGEAQIHKRFNVRTGILECKIRFRNWLAGSDESDFTERHLMRAFTPRELESALHRHGFDVLKVIDPESQIAGKGGDLRADSYYLMVVARVR
jgi:SAM-dependent methyltransferase